MKGTTSSSLVHRLTRALVMAVGGVWLLCLIGVGWYVSHEVNRNFDNELVESAHRLMDTAVHEFEQHSQNPPAERPVVATQPAIENYEPLVYQLRSGAGSVLVRTTAAPEHAFDAPLRSGFFNTGPWRIYTAAHPNRPLYLQLADPLDERVHAMARTLLGLTLLMLAVLPLLAWLLRVVARRELQVLNLLQADISQRSGHNLSPISLRDMPLELQLVVDDVNRMLERLSHALDVERALATNAAHELRTPLASVRLRLQTALDEGLSRADVQAALDAVGVLSHRTEKLLQLSRAESASTLDRSLVDLVQLAGTVAQEFWQSPPLQNRLHLNVPDEELQPVRGDVDALAIALRNLVENALRYALASRVVMEVVAPATLLVRDRGAGVGANQLATLQQRHVRYAHDHAGYGLGLSIVASIVQKHGGQLHLQSPLEDGTPGFEARIELPPGTP